MPLEAPISTKWHRTGRRHPHRIPLPALLPGPCASKPAPPAARPHPHPPLRWLKLPAAALLLALALVPAAFAALPAPGEVPVVRKALDQMARMAYDEAAATVAQGVPAHSPARAFFTGIAKMNRFLDLGDTSALREAEELWEPLSPRGAPSPLFRKTAPGTLALYRGLTGMQLSYAASLRGHRVRSTALALAARGHLEDEAVRETPEARASLMLFDYYRGRLMEKIPFMGEATFDAEAFEKAAAGSPLLRDMLLASLFWIHVDQGRFAAATAITSGFLGRYPGNRLARQMQAAADYRAGRLGQAREEYESLKKEYAAVYAARPPAAGILPLGYYRAVGNLARLHAARGDRAAAEAELAGWRRAERAGLAPWLPSVLRRDLARL